MLISDLNTAFDQYLKSHNCDRHTMREAWVAGACWVIQDTLETLAGYATACAGLKAESVTPSSIYDRAAYSLEDYYEAILKGKV